MYENDVEREERELVLGNKQLLGIFFVGTLLCGVFFALGYVVGGNSARATTAATAANTADGATPPTADSAKREEPSTPFGGDTASSAPASTLAQRDTRSSLPAPEPRVADNPAAAGSQPPPEPVSAHPATIPSAQKTASAPPIAAPAGVYVSVPEKGTSYWQVTATGRPAADTLVRSLRERQLPSILAESSKPELYRVLVGPYRSAPALAEAKRKLTDFGFLDIVPAKY